MTQSFLTNKRNRKMATTRDSLAKSLSVQLGIIKEDAAKLVNEFFAQLARELCENGDLKFSRFGNFKVRSKNPRTGRNPQTGNVITLPARTVITFHPSGILRESIREETWVGGRLSPSSAKMKWVNNESDTAEGRRTKRKAASFILMEMAEDLIAGDRVEIRGLGSFKVKNYGAYTGRNPKTGEQVHVSAKKLPVFRVGKELRERVDS
jgi:integration host factor subunit beta